MTTLETRRASELSTSEESVPSLSIKNKDVKTQKASSKLYRMLFREPCAWAGIIPALVSGSTMILTYVFYGRILTAISKFNSGENNDLLSLVRNDIIYMLVVSIVTAIAKGLTTFLWMKAGTNVSTKIKNEVFSAMMKFDITFFDKNSIGSLLSIISKDTATIENAFGSNKSNQVQQISQIIIALVLIFYYSWRIGLISFCILPIVGVVMTIFSKLLTKYGILQFTATSKAFTIADEAITGIKTVRSFNNEQEETNRFSEELNNVSSYETKTGLSFITMLQIANIFTNLILVANVYMASRLVGHIENGKLFEAGTLYSCFGYEFVVAFCFSGLMFSFQTEGMALQAGDRIISLIGYQPEINFEGGIQCEELQGHIEFNNVSFTYPTRDKLALNNVSFEIKPKQTIAIVGHSGSGKSTIVQLLERYYDPQEGIITIDGHNIKELDPRWLHEKIGLISQDPMLFHGTVRENVLYGTKESQNDDKIWNSLEMANAKKFVSKFEKKLEQSVGDKGNNLSGGQKQRVAIARAIIKDPIILIFR